VYRPFAGQGPLSKQWDASTTIELLLETVLCNPLLGSCNSGTTTMEMGVLSVWCVPRVILKTTGGTELVSIKIGMIFAMPVLTENPYIVKMKKKISNMLYVRYVHLMKGQAYAE
jgi:hypothetical protein